MLRRRGNLEATRPKNVVRWTLCALASLVLMWAVCIALLASNFHIQGSRNLRPNNALNVEESLLAKTHDVSIEEHPHEIPRKPKNLSRTGNVVATADVRGNLGPVEVVVQSRPGTDWIHDRWQAASDMHGTAIKGAHWIQLDFGHEIVATKIVLDWEAAYSDKYLLEASLEPITDDSPSEKRWTVFDTTKPAHKERLTVKEAGQSPGVKTKTPLHVIHTLYPLASHKPLRYLRLYILKSSMGWGVSLWQFDVIGWKQEEELAGAVLI